MIIIKNVSPEKLLGNVLDRYELRINKTVICKFDHRRNQGLAQCLRKAADAVEAKELDEILQVLAFGEDI